jgi:hypothetical protein
MEKVIRNGEVAVLISKGFGAGWYTWNTEFPQLLFHPKLVEMVEQNKSSEINDEWIKANLGLKDVYCGGAYDLTINWLPEGTHFMVDEYDGAETLRTIESLELIA